MADPLPHPDFDQPGPGREDVEPSDPRSVRALVLDIVGKVQEILRSEFRLATAELLEDLNRLGRGALFAGGAGLAFLLAVGLLLLAVVFALGRVMPLWGSALLVGLVVAGAGGALLFVGLRELRAARSLKPVKTIESVKETARWARDRLS